jgi:acylglycerol lipase
MTVERGTFAGVGAVTIHWERSAPASVPRAVVVVAHGYAEHFARYGELVRHLTERGFAVVGMDHRGHGRSEGARGHCGSIDELIADMRTLADMAEAWWPGVPRLLFGHSMGGLLGFVYLLRHPDTVRAAALCAPALRIPDTAPRALQLVARVLGRVAPRVGFRSKLDATLLSRDPAVGEAYVADPLVHRRASAGLVRSINAAQAEAFAGAASVRVPLLILQGDADRIVDPSGSRDVAARLTGPHELVMLPGYYHELLNEPKPAAAKVLESVDAWFDRWLPT